MGILDLALLPVKLVLLPLKAIRRTRRKAYAVADAFAATAASRTGTNAVQEKMGCGMVAEPIGAAILSAEELSSIAKALKGFPKLPSVCGATSRLLDDMLSEAVCGNAGPFQVVLLGTGQGSRSWRAALPPSTTIFEVGRGAAQKEHDARVKAGAEVKRAPRGSGGGFGSVDGSGDGGDRPQLRLQGKDIAFVEAELEDPLWITHLRDAGFLQGNPTVWVCEGLFSDMDATAVASVLRFSSFWSGPGSVLLADVFNDAFAEEVRAPLAERGGAGAGAGAGAGRGAAAARIKFTLGGGSEAGEDACLAQLVDESQCNWVADGCVDVGAWARGRGKEVLELPNGKPELRCLIFKAAIPPPPKAAAAETETFTF